MYKIEKNVPIPAPAFKEPQSLTATLRRMAVGDSLVLQPDETDRGRTTAYQLHNRSALRFTIRKQPDGTQRVWRVK